MKNLMGFARLKGDAVGYDHAIVPSGAKTFCGASVQLFETDVKHEDPRPPKCKVCWVRVYRAGAPISILPGPTQPFLKWTGGKRALLPQLERLLPDPDELKRRVYYEPFLGGGAMFFHLADRVNGAVLNDVNADLINCYTQVRDDVQQVIEILQQLAVMYAEDDVETYYNIRESYNLDGDCAGAARAAAFIFLNRTCFNGVYRVNKTGRFNVPIGRYKNPTICDEDALRAASAVLGKLVLLRSGRWQDALPWVSKEAKHILAASGISFSAGTTVSEPDAIARSFTYFDPPYDGTFTGYASGGFDEADQRELAQTCRDLDAGGGLFMASNADTLLIREIYKGFNITPVKQKVSINSDADNRGEIQDLVIRNYGG